MRILHYPDLQDESYYFGFAGCPDYFLQYKSNNQQSVYKINPMKDIEDRMFAVQKSVNTFRIFALGGSAVYGEPYGPKGAFPFWLEKRLNAIIPDTKFEVINCARRGFGSLRVKNIFNEILNYDPDLILVYFGNNEVRDDYFHRREINIEIRPFLNTLKLILDKSHIFRLVFHIFIKNKITSYGAEAISEVVSGDTFDRNIFSNKIDTVNRIRNVLDIEYGGDWISELDSSKLANNMYSDEELVKLRWGGSNWHNKIKRVFKTSVEHMVNESNANNIPIIFLTRAINLYYNRDARLVYEEFDDSNKIIEAVSSEAKSPVIETLPALLNAVDDEIGFNLFMDSVHPALLTNQIIAKEITKELIELKLINILDSNQFDVLEEQHDLRETIEREKLPLNSQCYSLSGWQKLVCLNASEDQENGKNEIIALAERAIELNPDNFEAYLLLGALYSMSGEFGKSKKVWEDMKLHFAKLK